MHLRRPVVLVLCLIGLVAVLTGCGGGSGSPRRRTGTTNHSAPSTLPAKLTHARVINVYSHAGAHDISPVVGRDPALVYVPNSMSNTVTEISQRTFKIVRTFNVGALPQHVTPTWDLRTLYGRRPRNT